MAAEEIPKQRYVITEKIKKEIINYCYYVYNEFIDKNTLTKYKLSHSSFLELVFRTSCDLYEETKNYEVYKDEISGIYSVLRAAEETFAKFQKGQVDILGVDKNEMFQFNLDPKKKLIYNNVEKTWEEDKKNNKNTDKNK